MPETRFRQENRAREQKNQEQELLSFYDYFDHDCYEYFRMGNDHAHGFHVLAEMIQKKAHLCPVINGQVVPKF